MTKEQFAKYQQIEEEIAPVRKFLFWCGNRYKEPRVSDYSFSLKTFLKNFSLKINRHWCTEQDNTFAIPRDLQCRIVRVMEEYLDEREKEKTAL